MEAPEDRYPPERSQISLDVSFFHVYLWAALPELLLLPEQLLRYDKGNYFRSSRLGQVPRILS